MNISVDQEALSTILNRNSELEAQVKELQEALTRSRNERRGIRYQVHEFHEKFGYPVRDRVTELTTEELQFRLRLVMEEAMEALSACDPPISSFHADWKAACDAIARLIAGLQVKNVYVPLLVDALGDLDYVVEGTRLYLGVNGAEVAAEIHRANMAKDLVMRDGIGKPVKPKGWKPPDIEGVLKKQGWKP